VVIHVLRDGGRFYCFRWRGDCHACRRAGRRPEATGEDRKGRHSPFFYEEV
jgi:hypothetical protein